MNNVKLFGKAFLLAFGYGAVIAFGVKFGEHMGDQIGIQMKTNRVMKDIDKLEKRYEAYLDLKSKSEGTLRH